MQVTVFTISEHLHSLPKLDGLVPCFMNPFAGTFHKSSPVSVGASADSYYEYLLKQWIQTGKKISWWVFKHCYLPITLCLLCLLMLLVMWCECFSCEASDKLCICLVNKSSDGCLWATKDWAVMEPVSLKRKQLHPRNNVTFNSLVFKTIKNILWNMYLPMLFLFYPICNNIKAQVST